MSKITEVLQSEIARLARKEIRREVAPALAKVQSLRRTVSQLGKTVAALEKDLKREIAATRRAGGAAAARAPQPATEGTRLSPILIKKLRKRLGVSQTELAVLLDVSQPGVASWEQGRARPRDEKRTAMIALRGLSRAEVAERLKAAAPAKSKKKARPRGRKPKR